MRFLFVLFCLAVSQMLSAQIMFEKTLRDTVSMSAQCAEPLPDGGYIACASIRGATRYHATLLRLDSAANVIWTKTYAGFVDQFAMDVKPVTGGGFVLLVQKQQMTSYEAMVIRTDSAGNIIWQQSYGGPGDEEVKEIMETSDGGFLISCQSNSYGYYPGATLIKIDAAGAVLWSRNYRGNRGAAGCSAKEVPTGGYILTARLMDSVVGYVNDVMVVRVDVNGIIQWSTVFGSTNTEEPYDIEVSPDNGCYVTGRLYGIGAGHTDIFLSRLDSLGNLMWTKTYGGPGFELSYDMDVTRDSGIVISGWTTSFSATTNDYYLIRTDSDGDTLWTSISNSPTTGGNFMWNVAETSDGGFICSGESHLTGNFIYVMYLVKTGPDGNTGCNQQGTATLVVDTVLPVTNLNVVAISGSAVVTTAVTVGTCVFIDSTYCSNVGIHEQAAHENQISVYPCPASTSITITSDAYLHNAKIIIWNSVGQLVQQHSGAYGHSVALDCSELTSGIYFITVTDGPEVSSTRQLMIINE